MINKPRPRNHRLWCGSFALFLQINNSHQLNMIPLLACCSCTLHLKMVYGKVIGANIMFHISIEPCHELLTYNFSVRFHKQYIWYSEIYSVSRYWQDTNNIKCRSCCPLMTLKYTILIPIISSLLILTIGYPRRGFS